MNRQNSTFSAFGGHLVDLWRLLSFRPSHPHSWSKFRQIKSVARLTKSKNFIETGTYLGNTSYRCRRLFDRVYTIELDSLLYERAREYLAPFKNIECILGDCLVELPKVMSRPEVADVLIFLDGHFSQGDTSRGDLDEPACEAILSLGEHVGKISAVIIDDFRTFNGRHGVPTKSALLRACEEAFGDSFEISVHLDQVIVRRVP